MSIFMVQMNQGNSRLASGSLDYVSHRNGPVTAASNASPIVITSANHGLVTGSVVTIAGVGGNTAANTALNVGAPWTVTVVDSNNFSLNNSNGNGVYTSGGFWSATSIQMKTWAPGANLGNRELADGEVFEDCNYWKQFTTDHLDIGDAFITLLQDDGIPYIQGQTNYLTVVNSLSVAHGSVFTANALDYIDTYGIPASSVSVSVTGSEVLMMLNNQTTSQLPILANGSVNDLTSVSFLSFSNTFSGGTTATVTVIATVAQNCTS